MASLKVILQFLGIVNVACIIAFNGAYQFSSPYLPNIVVVLILLALTALSVAKDIFDYIGVGVPYKSLYEFFRFASVVIPGILSSFVILIPKLLLMESQHLDSMPVKFTVRIIRHWDKEELSAYLNNLVEERGISYLISEADCNSIVESSNSMGELRNSLNTLVAERLEDLRSEVSNGAIEAKTIVVQQDSSWVSENTLLVVGITILTVAVIAGIGYLLYTNYGGSDAPTGNTSPELEIEVEIVKIHTLIDEIRANSDIDRKELNGLIDSATENMNKHVKDLEDSISSSTRNTNLSANSLRAAIDDLAKKVDDLSETLADIDLRKLKGLVASFQGDIKRASLISESALLKVTALSGESGKAEVADVMATSTKSAREAMRSALPQRSGLISGGVSDPVSRLSKKVNTMYKNIEARITAVEETGLEETKSAVQFAKRVGAHVKSEITNSEEFKFLRALKDSEAIREILMDEDVESIVTGIKKKD